MNFTEKEIKLFEAIADISYIAGYKKYSSGDSRADIKKFIYWAQEFETIHAETNWVEDNYMLLIEEYVLEKIKNQISLTL
jgi:hypothetical protein